jgi:hypothetical protein
MEGSATRRVACGPQAHCLGPSNIRERSFIGIAIDEDRAHKGARTKAEARNMASMLADKLLGIGPKPMSRVSSSVA